MQAEKVSIEMPKILIIKKSQFSSTISENQFFERVYELINESPLIGKFSQEEFWDYVIFKDFSTFETRDEMDTAYDVLLKEYRPDISLLFGCNLYDGKNIDWREYMYKRIHCGLKMFRSELNMHTIENHHSFQINLQDPLAKDYNKKAMLRLLYWFGDRYYS